MGSERTSKSRDSTPATHSSDLESLAIPELIAGLRSSFDAAANILVSRDNRLSEQLSLSEAKKSQLEAKCEESRKRIGGLVEDLERKSQDLLLKEAKCEGLEGELAVYKGKCSDLEEKVKKLEKYEKICGRHDVLIARMKEENRIACARVKEAQERLSELMHELKTKQNMAKKRLFECETTGIESEDDERKRKSGEMELQGLQLVEENMALEKNQSSDNSEHFMKSVPKLELEGDSNGRKCAVMMETSKSLVGMVVKEEMKVEADVLIEEFADAKNEASAHKWSEAVQSNKRRIDDVKDNVSSSEESFVFTASSKRKWGCKAVMTDSEDFDDDDVDKLPISQVMKKKLVEMEGSMNYGSNNDLVSQQQCVAAGGATGDSCEVLVSLIQSPIGTYNMFSRSNEIVNDKLEFDNAGDADENGTFWRKGVDVVGSENENERLDVHSINRSAAAKSPCSSNEASSQRVIHSSEFNKILAEMPWDIKKWRYENDMLFSLEEDPVLCMKAVCAIYRRQMSQEKSLKGTMDARHHGFNSFDAYKIPRSVGLGSGDNGLMEEIDASFQQLSNSFLQRFNILCSGDKDGCICLSIFGIFPIGKIDIQKLSNSTPFLDEGTKMAEFLLDGDPHGPLKKTVHELEEHDVNGLDYCRKLATHYSDQLFVIYQNNEDPFFAC